MIVNIKWDSDSDTESSYSYMETFYSNDAAFKIMNQKAYLELRSKDGRVVRFINTQYIREITFITEVDD